MKRKYTTISRLFTLSVLLFMVSALTLLGQTPNTFNYHAVLRDGDGVIRSNASVSIELKLHQTTETGTIVYSEVHNTSTDDFGMINLEIGSVTPATFATIDWAVGPYFVEVLVDAVSMGTSELLTVPYALYAVNGVPGPQGDAGPQGETGPEGPPGVIAENSVESVHVLDNSLTDADLATNSISSDEVMDGSLSHLDLSDAAGVEYIQMYGDVIPNTASELLSITVDAPASGYVVVLVTGWVNWLINTTSTFGWCDFGISTTSGDVPTPVELALTATETVSDYYKLPITVSKVFEVSAGANTFYFNGYQRVDIGTPWLAANMIGLFVPTRY